MCFKHNGKNKTRHRYHHRQASHGGATQNAAEGAGRGGRRKGAVRDALKCRPITHIGILHKIYASYQALTKKRGKCSGEERPKGYHRLCTDLSMVEVHCGYENEDSVLSQTT